MNDFVIIISRFSLLFVSILSSYYTFASTNSHGYIGTQLGYSHNFNACENNESCKSSSFGNNIILGYSILDGLSVESVFLLSWPKRNSYFDSTLFGMSLGPKFDLEITSDYSLYGKVSATAWVMSRSGEESKGIKTKKFSGVSPSLTLGFEYKYSQNVILRADATYSSQLGSANGGNISGMFGVVLPFINVNNSLNTSDKHHIHDQVTVINNYLFENKKQKKEDDSIKESVYFDFDSSILSEGAILSLNNFSNKHDKNKAYEIIGHADSIGTEVYNYKLGISRAASVKEYLLKLGFCNLTVSSKGKSLSRTKDNTEVRNKSDRKVTIVIASYE
ncbi:OmpA family protein [Photobacterium swingsii]|uniref:OmpA family protein n=1 Tax=Photobacterium swingsii TaxID=680026 RepID=UPI003554703D